MVSSSTKVGDMTAGVQSVQNSLLSSNTKPNKPGWNQQKMTRGEHRQSLMNRTAIFKRENTLKVLTSYVDPDQSK